MACLGKGGIAAFTIDQICREAGVSRGLINHHFKTKEDLLLQIYAFMSKHVIAAGDEVGPERQLQAIIERSFDESSFSKSKLNAWLSVYGQVSSHAGLQRLYRQRYDDYKKRIERGLTFLAQQQKLDLDSANIARQLIAMIDGLWLEYCLHGEGFTLQDARDDCYRFLHAYGIRL